jgi:hypothetical protein
MPDIGLRRRLKMTPGQREPRVPALAAGAIERLRKRMGVRPDAVDLLRQQIDGFDQAGVAAKTERHLVKAEVAVEHRQRITLGDGRAVLPLQFFQPVDVVMPGSSPRASTSKSRRCKEDVDGRVKPAMTEP